MKPENVVLTAMKKAEDSNGLIFRVYEWAGKAGNVEFHVPQGATEATMTNLMEKPEGSALKIEGDTVTAPIHPYGILTVRVSYPAKQLFHPRCFTPNTPMAPEVIRRHLLCAQHGRTLTGASPVTSWSQRVK